MFISFLEVDESAVTAITNALDSVLQKLDQHTVLSSVFDSTKHLLVDSLFNSHLRIETQLYKSLIFDVLTLQDASVKPQLTDIQNRMKELYKKIHSKTVPPKAVEALRKFATGKNSSRSDPDH
jgi:hypothetical protein